ncbi:MAG: hypothetical protein LBJ37_01325 [Paucimonas sp.]|jgi:hypothetical protein|nr:hypothetical protein [Paucimonas sp.]
MMEIFYSALLGVLGAGIGQFALYLFRRFKSKSAKDFQELVYRTSDMKPISIPEGRDLESLKERLEAFEKVSPRLAVIDGWNIVHRTLINRAIDLNKISEKETLSQELLSSSIKDLEDLADLGEDLKKQVEIVRACRNLIVHDSASLPDAAVLSVAESVVPLIKKIGLEYFPESNRQQK